MKTGEVRDGDGEVGVEQARRGGRGRVTYLNSPLLKSYSVRSFAQTAMDSVTFG